ncbi:MAG: flagellar biosynthetic protein FliQ [Bryobacteraceae bacterium]|nr:flagellar biosynthetic protein FliQ [Bryobacteraceae bacterium]MCX7604288.1 flagellar biosynthetic protein FliQ [Bryobacteraceae bacterium]
MTQAMAIDLIRQTLMAAFWLALPLLAIGFVSGIVISLVQIVTSFQDPSFGGALRLAAFLCGLLLTMPWMLSRIVHFTIRLFGDLSRYAS